MSKSPAEALATARTQLERYGCDITRVRQHDFYADCPLCAALCADGEALHVTAGRKAIAFECHSGLHYISTRAERLEFFREICREVKLYEEELFFTDDVPKDPAGSLSNQGSRVKDQGTAVVPLTLRSPQTLVSARRV